MICNTCQTDQQFATAAKSWMGTRLGEASVEVANANSGRINRVHLSARRDGDIVWRDGRSETRGQSILIEGVALRDILIRETSDSPLFVDVDDEGSPSTQGANIVDVILNSRESAAVELQFSKIVSMHKNELLIGPPNAGYGFDSFSGREQQAVSLYLFNAMTAQNPGWQAQEIKGGSLSGLLNTLKSIYGRGPKACMVFRNLDVACFQINLLEPNAARYISDTAKDSQDRPIYEPGGIGGGGGTSVNPLGNGQIGYGFGGSGGSGGDVWLICGKVGTTTSCYVQQL